MSMGSLSGGEEHGQKIGTGNSVNLLKATELHNFKYLNK
jgi:hypothetical protein